MRYLEHPGTWYATSLQAEVRRAGVGLPHAADRRLRRRSSRTAARKARRLAYAAARSNGAGHRCRPSGNMSGCLFTVISDGPPSNNVISNGIVLSTSVLRLYNHRLNLIIVPSF
jgi:hypothetical protein